MRLICNFGIAQMCSVLFHLPLSSLAKKALNKIFVKSGCGGEVKTCFQFQVSCSCAGV